MPARYANATFEGFNIWWRGNYGKTARRYADEMERALASSRTIQGLTDRLNALIATAPPTSSGAIQPYGLGTLMNWAEAGRQEPSLILIEGPDESGKTSLAVAAMRAWRRARGGTASFQDVADLSGRMRSVFYDTKTLDRSQDRAQETENAILRPLESAGILVLDRLGSMESDIRAVRVFVRLFFHRLDRMKPTIVTCESLEMLLASDGFGLRRLAEPGLANKLRKAMRVETISTCEKVVNLARVELNALPPPQG